MRFRYRLVSDKEQTLLKIRLRRVGLRNRPAYRVVVIDSRKARDGKYLESVGHYDPRTKLLELKTERIEHWVSKGAQTSDTVGRLLGRYTRQQAPAAEPVTADESMAATPVSAERVSPESVSIPENATPTDTPKE
jgi:small subunit ribosomal protein S16